MPLNLVDLDNRQTPEIGTVNNFYNYNYYSKNTSKARQAPNSSFDNWRKTSYKKFCEIKDILFWIMGFYILGLCILQAVNANNMDFGAHHPVGPISI